MLFRSEDFRCLPLGADKEDGFTGCDGVPDEGIGLFHPRERLLQVDDVDAVAFTKEELLHLRIPAVRLVSKVHASFQQFLDRDHSHAFTSLRGLQSIRHADEGNESPYSQAKQRFSSLMLNL